MISRPTQSVLVRRAVLPVGPDVDPVGSPLAAPGHHHGPRRRVAHKMPRLGLVVRVLVDARARGGTPRQRRGRPRQVPCQELLGVHGAHGGAPGIVDAHAAGQNADTVADIGVKERSHADHHAAVRACLEAQRPGAVRPPRGPGNRRRHAARTDVRGHERYAAAHHVALGHGPRGDVAQRVQADAGLGQVAGAPHREVPHELEVDGRVVAVGKPGSDVPGAPPPERGGGPVVTHDALAYPLGLEWVEAAVRDHDAEPLVPAEAVAEVHERDVGGARPGWDAELVQRHFGGVC